MQRLRCIYHVVRGQPVVQPPRLSSEVLRVQALGYGSGEGDNVVLHFRLNLLNAGYIEARLRSNGLGRLGRNHSILGENCACSRLHFKPAAVLVLFSPDAAHRGARIAVDQGRLLARATFRGPSSTLDCTRHEPSGARNPQTLVQLIDQQPSARLVGLEPLAVYHQLRNSPLAHTAHQLGRGSRVTVHIYFRVLDAVGVEELSGGPAIRAPGNPVHLHDHEASLPLSPLTKETPQQFRSLIFENSLLHLHLVIQLRMVEHGEH